VTNQVFRHKKKKERPGKRRLLKGGNFKRGTGFICIGLFSQKSPAISGSFSERDKLQYAMHLRHHVRPACRASTACAFNGTAIQAVCVRARACMCVRVCKRGRESKRGREKERERERESEREGGRERECVCVCVRVCVCVCVCICVSCCCFASRTNLTI